MALDSDETAQKRKDLAIEGVQLRPEDAVGLNIEAILAYFYDKILFKSANLPLPLCNVANSPSSGSITT